ncbi:peptidase M14 [Immersiella caudata]|uniref:Peptidase M14 n=1 Tax=Immersiella caudata TaxID=314043 RepID=A0AA39WIT4_9PEZI|nr:peptidase M14 [Immersiella caudata]
MKTTAAVSFLCLLLGTSACLTEWELHHGGHRHPHLTRRQFGNGTNSNVTKGIPVGVGDRFGGGTIAPRGLGILNPPYPIPPANLIIGAPPDPADAPFQTVYNTDEIKSASRGLVREFGLEYFETPHKTYENRTMFGFKVPGERSHGHKNSGYTVLLQAGIHARERGGPDHLINFIADLLWARREKKGLTYGGLVFTAEEVRTALSVGIVVLPLINPDGVAYDQATDSCWRKNRNRASATPNDTFSIGIDLNRNFPPGWDFKKAMAPGVDIGSSTDPGSEIFVGTAPLSEAETKNVDWTMDQMPDMRWFLDLHSFAGVLLTGWGHDSNQVTDKAMNLLNPQYDGKRGQFPDTNQYRYGEYYAQKAYDQVALAARSIVEAMAAVAGATWVSFQSVSLYPVSGAVSSHPMYRSLVDPKKKWAEGLTLEFGSPSPDPQCPFYPTVINHQKNMAEVGAAFMGLLLSAARLK